MSTGSKDSYDTLVEGSLDRGRDYFGQYSSADFREGNAYVNVLKRPEGFSIQWLTEKPLEELYNSLEDEYQPDRLITAIDSNGQNYWMDPDGWNGKNRQDLLAVEIPYQEFRLEWRPFEILDEDHKEEFSDLTLTSNIEDFDIERPHFTPAWELHPELSDSIVSEEMSTAVFNDIRFYMEDNL